MHLDLGSSPRNYASHFPKLLLVTQLLRQDLWPKNVWFKFFLNNFLFFIAENNSRREKMNCWMYEFLILKLFTAL